ncbi:MAG: type IV pili methyl-accepting chemotaxis transducer N-terminal domain-containing protein, partial [Burkholderiales bacterium]
MASKLNIFGALGNRRRPLTVLLPLFLLLLVATAYFVWANYRNSTYGAQYIADAGQLRMLSQRLGKASLQGLLGNPEAFKQV